MKKQTASIEREPAAPVVAHDERANDGESANRSGLAMPLPPLPADPQKGFRHRSTREPLKPDYVEPWTNEDLAPVVAAARVGRPVFDRVDPWNPNLVHPQPPPHEEQLDEDPWGGGAESMHKPASNKRKRSLETESPWVSASTDAPPKENGVLSL
jgi:hypothetical protein